MAIVYKITNKINNKVYIGQTIRTLEQRWKSHLSSARQGSPFRFHSAIRKYGEDAWNHEVLEESEDITYIKAREEQIITELESTTKKGYNGAPGGTGGFVVKPENYDKWRANHADATGAKNPNSLKITNEEIVYLALEFVDTHNRIPGHKTLISYGESVGVKIPKSFTKYRFNGSYKNLIKILEAKTGLVFDPYFKSEFHRKKLSEANIGKNWWSNDKQGISVQSYEENLDKAYQWYKGRKYDSKN